MDTDTLPTVPDDKELATPSAISTATPTPETDVQGYSPLRQKAIELKQQGHSLRSIAKTLGLHHSTVSHYLKSEIKQLAKSLGTSVSTVTREEIQKKIFSLAPKMVQNVESLANRAEKQEVQLKASTDLLDRAGFNPINKVVQLSLIQEMSQPELIAELERLIREMETELDSKSSVAPAIEPITTDPIPAENMGDSARASSSPIPSTIDSAGA